MRGLKSERSDRAHVLLSQRACERLNVLVMCVLTSTINQSLLNRKNKITMNFNLLKSRGSLAIFKIVLILWTLFFAGAVEQHKAQFFRDYESSLLAHTIYWSVLLSIGYLFSRAWKIKSFEHLDQVMLQLHNIFLLPVYLMLGLTLGWLYFIYSPEMTKLQILFFSLPLLGFIISIFMEKYKVIDFKKKLWEMLNID